MYLQIYAHIRVLQNLGSGILFSEEEVETLAFLKLKYYVDPRQEFNFQKQNKKYPLCLADVG